MGKVMPCQLQDGLALQFLEWKLISAVHKMKVMAGINMVCKTMYLAQCLHSQPRGGLLQKTGNRECWVKYSQDADLHLRNLLTQKQLDPLLAGLCSKQLRHLSLGQATARSLELPHLPQSRLEPSHTGLAGVKGVGLDIEPPGLVPAPTGDAA